MSNPLHHKALLWKLSSDFFVYEVGCDKNAQLQHTSQQCQEASLKSNHALPSKTGHQ